MPTLKKYLQYIGIIVILAIALIAWVSFKRWWKNRNQGPAPTDQNFEKIITEARAKMDEVDKVATIEIAAARAQESTVKTKLAEVVKIKDPQDRRAKLLALYQEVSK